MTILTNDWERNTWAHWTNSYNHKGIVPQCIAMFLLLSRWVLRTQPLRPWAYIWVSFCRTGKMDHFPCPAESDPWLWTHWINSYNNKGIVPQCFSAEPMRPRYLRPWAYVWVSFCRTRKMAHFPRPAETNPNVNI